MVHFKNTHNIFIFLLNFIFVAEGDRRIKDGKETTGEKQYAVYMVNAPISPQNYDAWLCGGAIVTSEYIITSAACVSDVQYMYAIAGYAKYVHPANLDEDDCTKKYKKKVIYTCVPKAYDFEYERIEKWSFIDIAVVKVESPYDFQAEDYRKVCSYPPKPIEINFDIKYQEPGIDAIVIGWGHQEIWRKPEDTTNYNSPQISYAPTLLHDKNKCKAYFADIQALEIVIDKYMICTLEAGNLDDGGNLIVKPKPVADGCTPNLEKMMLGKIECEEDDESVINDTIMDTIYDATRRTFSKILERQQSRKNGICQNDHGGPLVTWMGGQEILIGVASVFRVTNESKCTGPYLYTSTYCNGAFLDCIINQEHGDTKRRSLCNKPPKERGFDTVERIISWSDHPHGPADNERLQMRPQIPISHYRG